MSAANATATFTDASIHSQRGLNTSDPPWRAAAIIRYSLPEFVATLIVDVGSAAMRPGTREPAYFPNICGSWSMYSRSGRLYGRNFSSRPCSSLKNSAR